MRSVFSARITAAPTAIPSARARHVAGYARIVAKHNASASAPLHASVASIGSLDGPSSTAAVAPSHCVNGSSTGASIPGNRNSPNSPSDHAARRSAKLRAGDAFTAVSVGTRHLVDRHLPCAEAAAECFDGFHTLEARGAREDVDVDGAGLGPRVQDRVGFGE